MSRKDHLKLHSYRFLSYQSMAKTLTYSIAVLQCAALNICYDVFIIFLSTIWVFVGIGWCTDIFDTYFCPRLNYIVIPCTIIEILLGCYNGGKVAGISSWVSQCPKLFDDRSICTIAKADGRSNRG